MRDREVGLVEREVVIAAVPRMTSASFSAFQNLAVVDAGITIMPLSIWAHLPPLLNGALVSIEVFICSGKLDCLLGKVAMGIGCLIATTFRPASIKAGSRSESSGSCRPVRTAAMATIELLTPAS